MNGIRIKGNAALPSSRGRFFLRRQVEFDRSSGGRVSLGAPKMHKLQFAKGVNGPKEFWRMPSLPGERHRIGCFAKIHLYEENARFLLLAVLLICYLLLGAFIFQFIERENEVKEREDYREKFETFMQTYCSNNSNKTLERKKIHRKPHLRRHLILHRRHREKRLLRTGNKRNTSPKLNCTQFLELLDLRGNISIVGLMSERPKWDFSGSFYFVGTVISTIGFGMTTPRTIVGKVATMIYGFIGCASCILFFNLFLERIVTVFAYCLRYLRRRMDSYLAKRAENKRQTAEGEGADHTNYLPRQDFDELSSAADSEIPQWRPSVYAVFCGLFALCGSLICLAATLYAYMESWSYFEGIYFCFVSFATIGFGDYVPSQHLHYFDSLESAVWYRISNFVFLSIGCCCVYSLFNVSSIVIRQLLNWIIRTLDIPYRRCCKKKKRQRYMGLGLNPPKPPVKSASSSDSEMDDECFPPEDGLVSLKEFLEHNQASMLMMLQKQLIESARRNPVKKVTESSAISANSVGPLAILTEKFGND